MSCSCGSPSRLGGRRRLWIESMVTAVTATRKSRTRRTSTNVSPPPADRAAPITSAPATPMRAKPSKTSSRNSLVMKPSRRSFLEAGLTLPVLLGASPSFASAAQSYESGTSKDSSFDPWVEIHRENLRHNVQEISRRAASRPILAVIKNNGYGMGVTNVSKLLEPQPEIFGFAVVKLHEAMSLRDAGIRKPILLLSPFDEHNL